MASAKILIQHMESCFLAVSCSSIDEPYFNFIVDASIQMKARNYIASKNQIIAGSGVFQIIYN